MSDYREILASYSVPEPMDPDSVSRRKFLGYVAAGAGAATVGPMLGDGLLSAAGAAGGTGNDGLYGAAGSLSDGVLVVVMLGGGNDGLNTVAPLDNGRYHDLRPRIRLAPRDSHAIGEGMYLHPQLRRLKARYDGGQVAVVRGVGDPNADLSHFIAMGRWLRGHSTNDGTSGWLGRLLDDLPVGNGMTGVHVAGGGVPLHVVGRSTVPSSVSGAARPWLTDNDPVNVDVRRTFARFGDGSTGLGRWGDAIADTGAEALGLAHRLSGLGGSLPGDEFERQMVMAARIINAGLGTRVVSAQLGSFDHHRGQEWDHAEILERLDRGIEALFTNLSASTAGRVTLMTFSEFGRRAGQNGSNGTDHGIGSVSFVVGARVRGGQYGLAPDLNRLDDGNVRTDVDYRSLYASVLGGVFGADSSSILGGNYEVLPLFRSGVRAGPRAAPVPTATQGYMLLTSEGGLQNFGNRATHGEPPAASVAGMAVTPSRAGYWMVSTDGAIEGFGDASDHGSMAGIPLNSPIVGMAATPSGGGYWLLGEDGGIFSFGDAQFYGSTGNIRLNAPVVGMASHPTGRGYWFVASDGGIFTYGPDAQFYGSTGGIKLNRPIVNMAVTASGRGYWLIADDGGIFAYGDAQFYGSTGALGLNRPIVDMTPTPSGRGYWLVSDDGGIFAFGDAQFHGSGIGAGRRIIAIA